MDNVFTAYQLSAHLIDNRKILWSVLFNYFNNSRKNSILVISTAREFLLSKVEFINFLILIIAKPDIVCIRNPNAWIFNRNNLANKKLRYNLNSFAAILIRKALIKRATFVVCESQSQVQLIISKFRGKDASNCISFPGRLIDVKPIRKIPLNIVANRERLKVGVLGSIDTKKRNYEVLLKALEQINQDQRPILFFLGSRLPNCSESVLQKFREVTKIVHGTDLRMSEIDFYELGSQCDVLIAPLKFEMNYGANFGTGSVADGIALEKLVLFPKFIQIDESLNFMFLRYENPEELRNLLSRNPLEFGNRDYFNDWTIERMRRKLGQENN